MILYNTCQIVNVDTKPVTVQAIQLLNTMRSIAEAEMFINELSELDTGSGGNDHKSSKWEDYCRFISQDGGMHIKSIEKQSKVFVPFGNYIVKCPISGNFYSFDKNSFDLLYTLV